MNFFFSFVYITKQLYFRKSNQTIQNLLNFNYILFSFYDWLIDVNYITEGNKIVKS